MKYILVTSGEPSGIGPDICLQLSQINFKNYIPIIIGNIDLFKERAHILDRTVNIFEVTRDDLNNKIVNNHYHNSLFIYDLKIYEKDCIGKINFNNASYVLEMLNTSVDFVQNKYSNIIVTSPVSKMVLNTVKNDFKGHTEFFQKKFNVDRVLMMLVNKFMKVALLTTHVKISELPKFITVENLNNALNVLISQLRIYGIVSPKIAVLGFNPHCGEGGMLGEEEINVISPVIHDWQERGFLVSGPYSADTIFHFSKNFDVLLALYHDQGLATLKYADFFNSVNITLGLPIIRTSVDHGIALDLAGTKLARADSLISAIKYSIILDNQKL